MELKPVCEPFCLQWKICNLRHWSEEVHGDKLETIMNFDHGLRVEFRLFKDREFMLFFPPELRRYKGQLVIKESNGRVFCSMEKREDVPTLHFEKCEEKLGYCCVLCITLENACQKLRCEYTTTLLQSPASRGVIKLHTVNHVMRRERHFCRRQRRDPLNSNRDPQLVRQLIPSLESLSIGQVSNQPSINDLPLTIHSALDRIPRFYSTTERRVHTLLQIPTIKQPSTDLSNTTLKMNFRTT